jgi:glycosyltransferase involved in cell wall biosynthesis
MDKSDNPMKKKVLFLLEAFDKGGIEKVTLDIVNNLDPNKYDITVQTFWYGGHCQSLVNKNIRVIPFFFKRYVRGIIRLIDYLPPRLLHALFIREKYDIEIAASDGGAAKVISGSTNKKSKKVCWVHMDVIQQGSKLKEFKTKKSANDIYAKFNKIICVSNESKKQFNLKFGFENKSLVINNPIPTEKILKMSEEDCEIKFDKNKFNILKGRFR